MSSVRRAAVNFSLHLCLALLAALPLYSADLVLETQVGFHGLFQLGYPFPLRVELANPGPPVEGTLDVQVWKGGVAKGTEPYTVHYQRGLSLPAQSRRSIQFTVDPDSISRPLVVNFSGPGIKISKEVDLRRHFSPSPLVLLLTENSVSPSIPLASGAQGPLLSISLNQLPSDSRAYHGVSNILFYEQSLRDLSRSQVLALETWLSSGGRMIILGSIYYALYQEPWMNRFLPVRVAGLKELSSLPNLEKSYGKNAAPLKNLLVQDSKLVEGNILIEERGIPILVERSMGRGKILYLSLDIGRPPLSRWGGLSFLLTDLLGTPLDRRSTLQTGWDEAIFSQLLSTSSMISAYVPVRTFFLWLLIYLIGLGLLAWLRQKRFLPGRILALGFLLLVFFSSFGGYLHLHRGGYMPDGVLLSSTLLDSLQDGYVEAQSNVALFSTQRRRYGLQVKGGWSDVEAILPRVGMGIAPKDNALVIHEERSSSQFSFPLREWSYKLFRVRSTDRFPFRAEVRTEGGRLLLKLTNLTPRDLTDCWLVASGQRFSLGDILQGSSQVRELPLPSERPLSRDGQPKKTDLREISFEDKTKEILFRHSFFPQDQGLSRWDDGAVLFFGWVKGDPRRVWVDDAQIQAYNYALFRVIIPLEEGEE